MKASNAFLETLLRWGIDFIFGCPGNTEVPLLDAFVDRTRPKFLVTTLESIAVAMADGYSRVTGKPGLVVLHTNVGLANGIGQIHNAYVDGVPLVVIAGIKPTKIQGRGGFTTAHDIREMVRQYTKWDWTVMRADAIPENLNRAIRIALAPPQRPTFLAIPEDFLAEEIIVDIPNSDLYAIPPKVRPPKDLVLKAAEILLSAERPVILVGLEVGKDNSLEEVARLSEVIGAPVFCEKFFLEFNTFATPHPHFIGQFMSEHPLVQKADVLLGIGVKLFTEMVPPVSPSIPPAVKLIHMHVDPQEIGMIYPVTVPLVADTKSGVSDLLACLAEGKHPSNTLAVENRKKEIVRFKAKVQEFLARQFEEVKYLRPINRTFLGAVLGRIMDEETIVVSDGVTSSGPLIDYLPRFNQYSYYSANAGGCLGWGMGAPLGVKIATPKKKVIAFVGDGVFQFGLQSLFTSAKYNIPVVFVVANNGMFAAVICGLCRYKGEAAIKGNFPACDISGPDYAQIARGFGIKGITVNDPSKLEEVLRDAIRMDCPIVVDVILDPKDTGPIER
jgi:benzoylformate decarboxylase